MDYYNLSSEIIDSWDFIKNPTKEQNKGLFRERKSIDDNNQCSNVCFLKGVRRKLGRRKESYRKRKKVESSTSLILKKTTERQVSNDYSVLSFTNILQTQSPVYGDFDERNHSIIEKPLINVTVIPKKQQKQSTIITQRRRKKNPYKVSNPENSINTKNVYVVVAGRKTEKVYQINTTEKTCCGGKGKCSGKSEKAKDCEKLKAFVKSNMEKYIEKQVEQKKKDEEESDDSEDNDTEECDGCVSDCCCSAARGRRDSRDQSKRRHSGASRQSRQSRQSKPRRSHNIERQEQEDSGESRHTRPPKQRHVASCTSTSRKSRLRITGRVGLTDNDNYVLKCNATLDNKPIPTQFQAANCTLMPVTLSTAKEEKWSSVMRCFRPSKNHRDSDTQANVTYIPCPVLLGKTSQATQVNFDVVYEKGQSSKKVANYDKVVQCYCVNTAETATCVSDEDDGIELEKCQSPLVIISVYPKHESIDKIPSISANKVGISQDLIKQFSPQVYSQKVKQGFNTGNKPGEPKTKKAVGRSRSPSPVKLLTNNEKSDKETKTRAHASNSKKIARETIATATNKKNKTMPNKIPTKSFIQTNSVTNKKSEQKPRSRPVSPRNVSPCRRPGSPKPKRKATTGTNTEQMLTKKALVDDFTKQYTAQMERIAKDGPALNTKHNVSNINVDIDGDNEFYNVMFSQGELDAGVTVKKTIKNNVTNLPGDNDTSTSLENFLFIQPENEPRKRSFSQTLMFDGLQNDPPKNKPSKLNVRDSIEIFHRREERNSNVGKTTQTCLMAIKKDVFNDVDTNYLVPLKHFRGDDCSISDPIERDREIRELLGIDKGRFKPPVPKSSQASRDSSLRNDNQAFLRCLYQRPSKTQAKISTPIARLNVTCDNRHEDRIFRAENKPSPYQKLIFDRSTKLLHRLNQRNKQKSIVLTPQQYAKVRKTIYHILLKKNYMERRTKLGVPRCSIVSVGKVKAKAKEEIFFHFNKVTQTDVELIPEIPSTIDQNNSNESTKKSDAIVDELTMNKDVQIKTPEIEKRKETAQSKQKQLLQKEGVNTKDSIRSIHKATDRNETAFLTGYAGNKDGQKCQKSVEKIETTVLFNACRKKCSKRANLNEYPRKAASSLEIHYARVEYTKRVMFSSSETHTPPPVVHKKIQNVERKKSTSIHTIFKGHRRPLTPNLGTSAYSLYPEGGTDHSDTRFKCFDEPVNYELKPKKPFLKRLISCLVMRASRVSETKFPVGPVHKNSSVNSSIDSYHINSSLGAVDMSSSIYDTSASFYSNHTILPVTRMKRGFFSSVRVFLNNRRS